ncbi:MAG TPA: TIGR04013 family B12-binding domain/radical SAM domain-containing protein [Dictyoglomaceae bacterium]|nr:TIGR04013 family B12-binding domain/radical SAM domain-containing protein [Dictyoglomaceae bacterium]HOL38983.1 TIGR04013 family B12-binding domain/radical SAM domain-containing protein [Dictyoglomaceae bacterium]HPP15841.1 TIGR04013 family B12-binding domain/radical SAM domain-containing protein [Dictyoglomaceae bacterium]
MSYKLVFYNSKDNKYSINALLGAVEEDQNLEYIPIYFAPEKDPISFLKKIVDDKSQIIFCISFFTTQFFNIKNLIENVKEEFPEIILIAGGPHPSGNPYSALKLGFDIVIRGEGEKAFPNVINKLINGMRLKSIYEEKQRINLDDYFSFSKKFGRFGPIEISRGCPYVCYFCQTPQIFGANVRHRSISKVLEIVEFMSEKNLKDIRFITPNAFSYGSSDGKNINLQAIEELLSGIRKIIGKEGRIFFGSFPSEVRPEYVTEETIEIIKTYADNDNVVIGAQSGSQKILDLSHRGHKVADIYRAVEVTAKNGLKPNVDFIFGLPYEEEADIELTTEVILDLIKLGAKIHAHTFMPLPQTPFSKFPPGKISEEIKKTINKLIPKGVIFGNFREQEKLAWNLYNYFSSEAL